MARPTNDRPQGRAATIVVTLATVWFVLATSWGLFGPIGAGHEAIVASRGIIAENMLSWHIWAPVREYTVERPSFHAFYSGHPWGTFWYITAFAAVLGRHAYVPRLAAVVVSGATPPLLYGIGRALWGPGPGALAALAYATLPITLAFGNFPGFEGPLVACCLLTTWGYVRFALERRRRWMAVSLIGVFLVANADWEGHVFLAVAIFGLAASAFFLPRWPLGETARRQFAQWATVATLLAGATLAAYVAYFQSIESIGGLASQEARRSSGNNLALSDVLAARRYWIDLSFTPLAIFVGKIALPVFLARIFFTRKVLEIFPLAMLAMAATEYVIFKNGADLHIYWPLPFAPYYALSVGVLTATAQGLMRAAGSIAGQPQAPGRARAATLIGFGLIPIAILPDGIDALRYARMTGGRFDEQGRRAFRDVDKAEALQWMGEKMRGRSPVAMHDGMHAAWAQAWALHRPMKGVSTVPSGRKPGEPEYFIADLTLLSALDQLQLARSFSLTVVGQFAMADLTQGPPLAATGYVFDEREPTWPEWFLVSGCDRMRTVRPDPFFTWELREHYGQTPNPAPTTPPSTPDQLRIAHNVAVALGDTSLADRYEHELLARIDAHVARTYRNGTRLLGERYDGGVEPTLTVYFLAGGRADSDYSFEILSFVDANRFLSLVPRDGKVKPLGMPFALPTRLWKTGFIYAARSEIRHRPGRERFVGFLGAPANSPSPQPRESSDPIPLLTVR